MSEARPHPKPAREPDDRVEVWGSTLKARPGGLKRTAFNAKPSKLYIGAPELKPASKPKAKLRARSAKAAKDDRTFKAGSRSEWCARCGTKRATDASHRAPRSQRPDLRGDSRNRDDLCRECHELIGSDYELAVAEGWRDPERYELANADPMAKVLRKLGEAP